MLLLEGKVLIEETLKLASVKLNRIFCVKDKPELEKNILKIGITKEKICRIDENLMNLISNVKTNQGIVGDNFIL